MSQKKITKQKAKQTNKQSKNRQEIYLYKEKSWCVPPKD
jgi:hypothetical protein